MVKKITIKAGNAESWVVNSAKLEAKSAAKSASDVEEVDVDDDDDDDNLSGKNAATDNDSASVVSVASVISSAESVGSKTSAMNADSPSLGGGGRRGGPGKKGSSPKNMEEFRKVLKDNLRTKDGAYCKAKDENSIECVCGKIVRICNKFYWRYMVQRPKVINGRIQAKGHWYACEEVKRRGNLYDMSPELKKELAMEVERQKKRLLNSNNADSDADSAKSDRSATLGSRAAAVKAARAAADKKDAANKDFLEEDEFDDELERERREMAASPTESEKEYDRRQAEIKEQIDTLLKSREIGTTFLQDGPCYQVEDFVMIFKVPIMF